MQLSDNHSDLPDDMFHDTVNIIFINRHLHHLSSSKIIIIIGGERNRKQRIPVNSITSKLVLKSIYASGSTGPFFADHYLNRLNSSFAKKNWLPVKITCYSCIIWNMICKKKKLLENRNGIFCQKFCNLLEIFEITEQELLLDCLLSAWTFVYWNMEVLLELLIIEIIFLQSKFTQSYWTNVEKIKFSIFCFAQLLGVFFIFWTGCFGDFFWKLNWCKGSHYIKNQFYEEKNQWIYFMISTGIF